MHFCGGWYAEKQRQTLEKKLEKLSTKTLYKMSTKCCSYCKAAGKSEADYSNHWVKDKVGGKVVCPALLANECGYCHAKGHTPKFCPKLKARDARRAARPRCKSTRAAKPASLAGFAAPVLKQMRQQDAEAAAQKRARARCNDNQYAALLGVGPVMRKAAAPERRLVKGPKVVQPRAPQGAWGAVAKVASEVRDLNHAEIAQLRAVLRDMGIMDRPAFSAEAEAAAAITATLTSGPSPAEQAWLEAQMAKTSQTAEETAEGEAFFDNDSDVEEAVVAMSAEAAPMAAESAPIPLPEGCDLDADFGEAGDDGWGSE